MYFALQVWGAYTWRGLFSEFYGIPSEYFRVVEIKGQSAPLSLCQ